MYVEAWDWYQVSSLFALQSICWGLTLSELEFDISAYLADQLAVCGDFLPLPPVDWVTSSHHAHQDFMLVLGNWTPVLILGWLLNSLNYLPRPFLSSSVSESGSLSKLDAPDSARLASYGDPGIPCFCFPDIGITGPWCCMWLFRKCIFIILCAWVFWLHIYLCFMCIGVLTAYISVHHTYAWCLETRRGYQIHRNWSYRWLWAVAWGLGIEPGSSKKHPMLLIIE